VPVPGSGAVIAVLQLHSGRLVGIGTDRQLYTRATLASPWSIVPGSGRVVSIAQLPDGTLIGTGADRHVYRSRLAGRRLIADAPSLGAAGRWVN
jgi:hypothetical protein